MRTDTMRTDRRRGQFIAGSMRVVHFNFDLVFQNNFIFAINTPKCTTLMLGGWRKRRNLQRSLARGQAAN